MSDALPTILGIVLVALAAGFALLPLARGSSAAGTTTTTADALQSTDRSLVYRQVLELEFDYQLGKLSTEDFQQLSAELLGQAGQLLREEHGDLAELDDEIEREIAAARAAFSAARQSGRSKRTAGTAR
jgi:hypothetical protein